MPFPAGTLTLDSAEALRASLTSDWASPDAALELAAQQNDAWFREAQATLGLKPHPEPDEPGKVPGKTACHWCGRSDEPMTRLDYRPARVTEDIDPRTLAITRTEHPGPMYADPSGLHCIDAADCMQAHLDREPDWADHQMPKWRRDYSRYLAEEARRVTALRRSAWGAYHPQMLAEQDRQLRAERDQLGLYGALAAELRPPDSFFSDLAVALAARRSPDAVELAAPAEGIFASPDTTGPAPFALLPFDCGTPGCTHDTLRCGRKRGHLPGELRRLDPRASDPAATLARRSA